QTVTIGLVTDDAGQATGTVASGATTDDTSPTVSGTLTAALGTGEFVQVLRDGTVVGTATVTGTGWSFSDSGLGNSTYSYTARVADTGGTQGTASSAYTITVATSAPGQTVSIVSAADDAAPGTGTLASGAPTTDPSPTLSGTLSAALSGGEYVQVLRGATVVGT